MVETSIRDIVIGLFLMSMIVIGISTFYVDLATQTRDPTLPNVNVAVVPDTFILLNETHDITNQSNLFFDVVSGIPLLGEIAALTKVGFSVGQSFLKIPNFFLGITQSMTTIFGLPVEVITLVQGLVMTIIMFVLLSALMKWRI